MNRYNLDETRCHWQNQADQHQTAPEASWSDTVVIDLEIKEVLTHLHDGQRVLDAGCANGYSTLHFAAARQIDVLGIDYIPEMVSQARAGLRAATGLRGQVDFQIGDVTALDLDGDHFDTVLLKRVIASLGTYENQLRGIRECTRVLKPGGLLLLSDATLQGWNNLNAFRQEWRLPPIPMPPFNNYLDREQLCADLSPILHLESRRNFASTYFVGTRIIKPLLIQALGLDLNGNSPNMEWNRWMAQLPAWGEYGTQELFVLRKR